MKRKILIADDQRDLVLALERYFTHFDYEVVTAFDGIQALHKVHHHDFDLVILDIMMPRMDGLSVLTALRAEHNPIPVLIITAQTKDHDKEKATSLGANDFLEKPFKAETLLKKMEALLQSKGDNE